MARGDIQIVATMDYPAVFLYLGEVFAVDGVECSLPRALVRHDRLVGEIAAFYRSMLASPFGDAPRQVLCPDKTFAVVSGSDEPFAVVQISRGALSSKSKNVSRRRILHRCGDSRYHSMAREHAALHVFREVVVHGLPNVNKNIVANCEIDFAQFTRSHLMTIRNCAAQIRVISSAHRVLSPSWRPVSNPPPP